MANALLFPAVAAGRINPFFDRAQMLAPGGFSAGRVIAARRNFIVNWH